MNEDREKSFPISKEDVGPLVLALICLAVSLFLFFGPSPVKMLFSDKPAATGAEPAAPKPASGMMPAGAEPEPADSPEQPEKPAPKQKP
jgi:hypothetical protein